MITFINFLKKFVVFLLVISFSMPNITLANEVIDDVTTIVEHDINTIISGEDEGSSEVEDDIVLSGDGTEDNPYKLSTAEELQYMANKINNSYGFNDKIYELQNDIDISTIDWEPIGNFYNSFKGIFDGKGYKITGLNISNEKFINTKSSGLFGYINGAEIKNLGVVLSSYGFDFYISEVDSHFSYYIGILASNSSNSKINKCYSLGKVTAKRWDGYTSILATSMGGLVGYSASTTIEDSFSINTLEIEDPNYRLGGLAGTSGSIYNSYAASKLTYTASEYNPTGALVSDAYSNVVNSYYDSDLSGHFDVGKGKGLRTDEMKKFENFFGWDFEYTWTINPNTNNGYPYLVYLETTLPFTEGDGSIDDPYIIENEIQLNAIRKNLNKHYKLKENIFLTKNWMPIGNIDKMFTGSLDGSGFIISNINIPSTLELNQAGFFGVIGKEGLVKNLGLQINEIVSNTTNQTSEAAGGMVAKNLGTIEKSYVIGNLVKSEGVSSATIGGFVGTNSGKIEKCYSNISVTALEDNASSTVGGFVGINTQDYYNYSGNIEIINCFSLGDVSTFASTKYTSYIGSFAGLSYEKTKNCFAIGSVNPNSKAHYIRGFTGNAENERIIGCYYDKEVIEQEDSFAKGLYSAQMRDKNQYLDWDFDNVWDISPYDNNGYPFIIGLPVDRDSSNKFALTLKAPTKLELNDNKTDYKNNPFVITGSVKNISSIKLDNIKVEIILPDLLHTEDKIINIETLELNETKDFIFNISAKVPIYDNEKLSYKISIQADGIETEDNNFDIELEKFPIILEMPVLKASVNNEYVKLNWDYNGNIDLVDHFSIMRATKDTNDFKEVTKTKSLAFNDYVEDGEYLYKVVVFDKYGNQLESNKVDITYIWSDITNPTAIIGIENLTVLKGIPILFDATLSFDDIGVYSYLWEFDDGTESNQSKLEYIFEEVGEKTVKLTVWDKSGNSNTDVTTVKVVAIEDEKYRQVKIEVKDGQKSEFIADAEVIIEKENDTSSTVLRTDSNGEISLPLEIGEQYVAMVLKEGYSIEELRFLVSNEDLETNVQQASFGNSLNLSIVLNRSVRFLKASVVTTELTDPEDIKAAGIDVNDPNNSYVSEFKVTYAYKVSKEGKPGQEEEKEEVITYYKNSQNKIIQRSGYESEREINIDGKRYFIIPFSKSNKEQYFLILEGKTSWLKQIFKVELILNNSSEDDWIENCVTKLDLPEGLSFASLVGKKQNEEIKIGKIDKSEDKTVEWFLRGENPGEYHITVDVKGKYYPTPVEEFERQFSTDDDNPIVVMSAKKSLSLTIADIPEEIEHGDKCKPIFILKNISNRTLNFINFTFGGEVWGYDPKDEDNPNKLKLTIEKQTEKIDKLDPGESIKFSFDKEIVFNFSADKDVTKYILNNICRFDSENVPVTLMFTEKPEKKKAIVIVPGTFGSNLKEATGDTIWFNILKLDYLYKLFLDENGNSINNIKVSNNNYGTLETYKNLITRLNASANIKQNYDIIFFPYDWRMDFRKNAEELKDLIKDYEDVIFIAHSQGGMVVSTYIAMNPYSEAGKLPKVDKFFAMGVPFLGLTKVLDIKYNGILSMIYRLLLATADIKLEITFRNQMRLLAEQLPSGYQMYPQKEWYNLIGEKDDITPVITYGFEEFNNIQVLDYAKYCNAMIGEDKLFVDYFDLLDTFTYKDHPRILFDRAKQFNESIFPQGVVNTLLNSNIPIYTIYSNGHLTPGTFNYHKNVLGGDTFLNEIYRNKYGDNTVSMSSATLNFRSYDQFISSTSHNDLPKDDDIINYIINNINSKGKSVNSVSQIDASDNQLTMEDYILFRVVASSENDRIDIKIKDQSGEIVASVVDSIQEGIDNVKFSCDNVGEFSNSLSMYIPKSGYDVDIIPNNSNNVGLEISTLRENGMEKNTTTFKDITFDTGAILSLDSDKLKGEKLDKLTIGVTENDQYREINSNDYSEWNNYKIECDQLKGEVSYSSGMAASGSKLYISAKPKQGYRFVNWSTSNGGDFDDKNSYSTSFIMPNNETTITANFELLPPETYKLTINPAEGGTITKGTTNDYSKGEVIELVATPNQGYKFKNWTTTNGGTFANSTSATTTFTMPGNETTITANFEALPSETYKLTVKYMTGGTISKDATGNYAKGEQIELVATPSSGYRFKNWTTTNGGTFANSSSATTTFTMPGNETTITANFELLPSETCKLTINSTTGGTITKGATGNYAKGEQIELIAVPSSGYRFKNWATTNGGTFANSTSATTTFTMPDNETTVTANFELLPLETYKLTVNYITGGTITKGATGNYAKGEQIELVAVPSTGYKFKNWTTTNGGTFANSSSATTTFTMPGNETTITANFELLPSEIYKLTINSTYGGTITKGVTGNYAKGEQIELIAVPSSGYRLKNWTTTNGGTFANSSSATTTFTMPGNETTITANFELLPSETYKLTINSTSGGTITKGSTGNYAKSEQIELVATSSSGYRFKNWTTTNEGTFANVSSETTTFTMPGNETTITANFELLPSETYKLTINSTSGGTITKGSTGNYAKGEQIELVATPSSGYRFKNWITTNGGTFANSTSVATIFTMPGNVTTIYANFEYIGSIISGGSTPPTTDGKTVDPTPEPPEQIKDINDTILALLKNNKDLIINIDKDVKVSLLGKILTSIMESNKDLRLNNGIASLVLTPENIAELNLDPKDTINIAFALSTNTLNNDLLKNNTVNTKLIKQFYKIQLSINNKQLDILDSMFSVEFNMSSFNFDKNLKDKTTGIRYVSSDTINQLGGKYTDNIFEFKTSKPGIYGVLISENITKIWTGINKAMYILNGKTIFTDVAPTLVENRTMVPVRFIAEAIGATVDWDGSKKMVTIKLDNSKTISMVVGQPNEYMDVAPVLINNRTLVPLRYISEQFDSNIIWNKKDQSIEIYK